MIKSTKHSVEKDVEKIKPSESLNTKQSKEQIRSIDEKELELNENHKKKIYLNNKKEKRHKKEKKDKNFSEIISSELQSPTNSQIFLKKSVSHHSLFEEIERQTEEILKQKKRFKNVIRKLKKKQFECEIIKEENLEVDSKEEKNDNKKCNEHAIEFLNSINESEESYNQKTESIERLSSDNSKSNRFFISKNRQILISENLTDRPLNISKETFITEDRSQKGESNKYFDHNKSQMKLEIIEKERALRLLEEMLERRTLELTIANEELEKIFIMKKEYEETKKELFLTKNSLIYKDEEFEQIKKTLENLKEEFYLKEKEIEILHQELNEINEENEAAMYTIKILTMEIREIKQKEIREEKREEIDTKYFENNYNITEEENIIFESEESSDKNEIQELLDEREIKENELELLYAQNKIEELENKLMKASIIINSLKEKHFSMINSENKIIKNNEINSLNNNEKKFTFEACSEINYSEKINEKNVDLNKGQNSSINLKLNIDSENELIEMENCEKSESFLEHQESENFYNKQETKNQEEMPTTTELNSCKDFFEYAEKEQKFKIMSCGIQTTEINPQKSILLTSKMFNLTNNANEFFENKIKELEELCLKEDSSQEEEEYNSSFVNETKKTINKKDIEKERMLEEEKIETIKAMKNVDFSTSCGASTEENVQKCILSMQKNLTPRRNNTFSLYYEKEKNSTMQSSEKDYESLKVFAKNILPILNTNNNILNAAELQEIFASLYKAENVTDFEYNFIRFVEGLKKKNNQSNKKNIEQINKEKKISINANKNELKMIPIREGGRLLSTKKIVDSFKNETTKKYLNRRSVIKTEESNEDFERKSYNIYTEMNQRNEIKLSSIKTPSVKKYSITRAPSTTSPLNKGLETPQIKNEKLEDHSTKFKRMPRLPLSKKNLLVWKK